MDIEAYEKGNKKTLNDRIAWWRDARFGMFIHYGVYSCYGRGEWIYLREGISQKEYIHTINTEFDYRCGAAEEWVKCAVAAGMKYAVLTTQHHDGFALWDSKANPYNSVNLGPKCDIVKEFTDACRKHGLKVGLYFSLVNWHHPDGMLCQKDESARLRFIGCIKEELKELMTMYGKIDILWYDGAWTLPTAEAWGSLERNQMIRKLQPHILINDRSLLKEDFSIAEDHLKYPGGDRDWEGCMRFSNTAFGGVDHSRALPFKMNAHDIVKLLSVCQFGGGNLIFNISPNHDGSIDIYEKETLETVGRWIKKHSEAVYGASIKNACGTNGISTAARKGNKVYIWNWIWSGSCMRINGYKSKPVSVRSITTGQKIDFTYDDGVIRFENLPERSFDDILDFTVFEMDFGENAPEYDLVPKNALEFINI